MRKYFSILAILFLSIDAFSQTDFRNVKWGMSIIDVQNNETAPLESSEKNISGIKGDKIYYEGNELCYKDVTVGGKKADIYYHFNNGKLTKIRVVFRHDLYTNYNENLTKIVLGFSDLYKSLNSRGFKFSTPLQCGSHAYSGADYTNPINSKILTIKPWGMSQEVLKLNEKMISENHYEASFFRMENIRCRGFLMFFTEYSDMKDVSPVILELSPNSKIEQGIKNSDF